jgi:hypothetical protein
MMLGLEKSSLREAVIDEAMLSRKRQARIVIIL